MNILLDARMMGHNFGGIGVYTRELFKRLPKIGLNHQWLFLHRPEQKEYIQENIVSGNNNVELHSVDVRHYSLAEQLKLSRFLNKLKPDLVHFPNFNHPILYKGKFVVTIHDLVHHKVSGHRRGGFVHFQGYKMAMANAVNNSQAIISVSRASKQDILSFYPKTAPDKIYVIPEGVEPAFNPTELPGEIFTLREKYHINQPYILFLGTREVKRNLPFLAEVFKSLAPKFPDLQLVMAGRDDPWHPEVDEQIKEAAGPYGQKIIMPGVIDPEDLPALFRQAQIFVNASPNEGFGLPGLEAMACGTPVIVADVPVFREVYGHGAAYFNHTRVAQASEVVESVLVDHAQQESLKARGLAQAGLYSWPEAAARTMQLYEAI